MNKLIFGYWVFYEFTSKFIPQDNLWRFWFLYLLH